ncbi:hypothetical protein KTN05_09655 [Paracoccus sp. Z118]|uniref:hypothetical protein n=1 Tax=Paracoccus sp. Z118 TaxID=2851017 RepID=UPI001C2C4529|nr:hypothetical protein [Paracoccus sp. Z118]MBV0892116.1 hypothetical protein [Paracoccus sp. Z118]
MMRASLSQRLVAFITLPTLLMLALGWFWLDDPALFFKEGRTVEFCSVVLLFQAIICWFAVHGRAGWREWQIPALLLLFAMREMDFDKRFTEHGLLKLRTYTGDAPIAVKLLGSLAILFSLVVIWRIVTRNARPWWQDLKRVEFHAIAVLLAGVLTVAAKTLDGLGRKLLDVGITVSARVNTQAGHIEESIELVSWWLLGLAIAHLPAARRAADPASRGAMEGWNATAAGQAPRH